MKQFAAIFLSLFAQFLTAQTNEAEVIPDKFSPALSAEVNRFVGDMFNASYNNPILIQDIHTLVHPFTVREEHHCWQGGFWGKRHQGIIHDSFIRSNEL